MEMSKLDASRGLGTVEARGRLWLGPPLAGPDTQGLEGVRYRHETQWNWDQCIQQLDKATKAMGSVCAKGPRRASVLP
jgi:hypothetical protein